MTARDGAELLNQLRKAITKYVVMPSENAINAVTLWIAATHGVRAWRHAPRLVLSSPLKRCGKSRLLDIVDYTARRTLMTLNASTAAIYHVVGGNEPRTLLVDEADAIFGTKRAAEQHEDLRALINAGFQKGRPVLRYDVNRRGTVQFETFAMVALAGIGDLPDTIVDRAVVVPMRRRRPDERVSPFRERRDGGELRELCERLSEWIDAHVAELADAEPDMPVEDRAADTWEPLVAVADLAGGEWPELARAAAKELTEQHEQDDGDRSYSIRLLADCQEVLSGVKQLTTDELCKRLCELTDAPWRGFELDAHSLARRLRPYGVGPTKLREGDRTPRGYKREAFLDAWERYLPRPEPEQTEHRRSDPTSAVPPADLVPEHGTQVEHENLTLTWDVPVVPDRGGVGGADPPHEPMFAADNDPERPDVPL